MSVTHFSGPVASGADSVEVVTGDKAVSVDDNGKTFLLKTTSGAGAAITLPAVQAGLRYKFIVGLGFATTAWTVTPSDASSIYTNGLIDGVVYIPAGEPNSVLTLSASAETIGDSYDFVCDGTSWFLTGIARVATAFTCTG